MALSSTPSDLSLPSPSLLAEALAHASGWGAEFDDVVALAARVADAPFAWLTLADASGAMQVVARFGLDEGMDDSLLALVESLNPELPRLTVPDAQDDPCFVDEPVVAGAPALRFVHAQAERCVAAHEQHVAARDHRLAGGLGHVVATGDRLHLEIVAEDHAAKTQLITQHVL